MQILIDEKPIEKGQSTQLVFNLRDITVILKQLNHVGKKAIEEKRSFCYMRFEAQEDGNLGIRSGTCDLNNK